MSVAPAHAFGTQGTYATQQTALPSPAAALDAGRRAADWQLAHRKDFSNISIADASTRSPARWQQATFYIALTHLADRTGDRRYREALRAIGRDNRWQLAPRPFHADDQAIGAVYVWDRRNGGRPETIAPFRTRADAIIAAKPQDAFEFRPGQHNAGCQRRWCWSDALFMAPPAWFALWRATGDRRYADYAHREFGVTVDHLFDREEKLFFRDSRFIAQRTPNGAKIFWSRGNGWAFAGMSRILDMLPANDPRRHYYIDLFRQMAARLITIQKSDGYWAPSLLEWVEATPPESSGTAFFTYGLAWGISRGLLDRSTYLPAVERGWAALERSVTPEGMVGAVQQVGDQPDRVASNDTQYYGTGAYILAATAIYDLGRRR